MTYPNRRQSDRFPLVRSIRINFSPEIFVLGQVKNISVKGAFVQMKHSIYVQQNDKLDFEIQISEQNSSLNIAGEARISRIVPGEGIAIYFTKIDEESLKQLHEWLAGEDPK